MKELPQGTFFEGFYIWFSEEEKEEYYSTPLYLYSTLRKDNLKEGRISLKLQKDITKVRAKKNVEVLKHPTSITIHYFEKFGMLLIKFLNADLSSFESAYNTFFYAYGFELLKQYAPYNNQLDKFSSEVEFIKVMKNIYDESLDKIIDIQKDFQEVVDFIYNLNGNDVLLGYTPLAKFIGYIVKHENDIYTYSSNVEIIQDDYSKKNNEYDTESLKSLVEKIEKNKSFVKKTNIYTSIYLGDICFLVLEQIVNSENTIIKTCKNCGRYFIPTVRQDEVYCELPNVDDSNTCREKGASQTYKKNLENIPALLEYRRSYQKKIMIVSRNKEDKNFKKEFDKWKKEAQLKIKDYKQGKLSEENLYNWMLKNR